MSCAPLHLLPKFATIIAFIMKKVQMSNLIRRKVDGKEVGYQGMVFLDGKYLTQDDMKKFEADSFTVIGTNSICSIYLSSK